jgi:hypothetical protein
MWPLPVVLGIYQSKQYGYSICTSGCLYPSDFVPSNGIKAEATPNTEMTLIVDVDINLLKELHEHGSVNTMKDRRHDLYSLKN